MTTTHNEQQYTRKDLEKLLRTSESEIPFVLKCVYENRCTYTALGRMLKPYSVNEDKFKRLCSYLIKEHLVEPDSGIQTPIELTRKAKDVIELRFDRKYP
ncbi:MAG: hypothetical protein KGH60_02630 [Candidatus Micrarchaeota archaeon]|nr:hypothetical protein [Candidatus Micrarchaeota archaeon]